MSFHNDNFLKKLFGVGRNKDLLSTRQEAGDTMAWAIRFITAGGLISAEEIGSGGRGFRLVMSVTNLLQEHLDFFK